MISIEKKIMNYLNSESKNGALLLDGVWGIGKTHFICNFLSEKKFNDISLRISCLDANTIQELELEIFKKTRNKYIEWIEKNKGTVKKWLKPLGNLAAGVINKFTGVDLARMFNDITSSLNLGTIDIEKEVMNNIKKEFDNKKLRMILILDDLERSNIDVNKLLSFITKYSLSEDIESEFKIICLANSDCPKLGKGEENILMGWGDKIFCEIIDCNKEKYFRNREWLFSKECCFIEECFNFEMQAKLLEYIKEFFRTTGGYNSKELKNIRKLKWYIKKFNNIFSLLNNVENINNGVINVFLKHIFQRYELNPSKEGKNELVFKGNGGYTETQGYVAENAYALLKDFKEMSVIGKAKILYKDKNDFSATKGKEIEAEFEIVDFGKINLENGRKIEELNTLANKVESDMFLSKLNNVYDLKKSEVDELVNSALHLNLEIYKSDDTIIRFFVGFYYNDVIDLESLKSIILYLEEQIKVKFEGIGCDMKDEKQMALNFIRKELVNYWKNNISNVEEEKEDAVADIIVGLIRKNNWMPRKKIIIEQYPCESSLFLRNIAKSNIPIQLIKFKLEDYIKNIELLKEDIENEKCYDIKNCVFIMENTNISYSEFIVELRTYVEGWNNKNKDLFSPLKHWMKRMLQTIDGIIERGKKNDDSSLIQV